MSRPAACAASMMQLLIGLPPKSTVHAPQTPIPHPSFAPTRPRSSRSTVRRVREPASTFRSAPFTFRIAIGISGTKLFLRVLCVLAVQCSQNFFRSNRQILDAHADGIFYRVRNRGGGRRQSHLTDP